MAPTFDIPSLIPPLPPSSIGKENDKKLLIKNQYPTQSTRSVRTSQNEVKLVDNDHPVLPMMGPNFEYSSPLARGLNGTRVASQQRLQLTSSPGVNNDNTVKRRSVLRFGETMESLFCLSDKSPKEHWKITHEIVNGNLSEDPSAWGKVLQIASKTKLSSTADLIRLHRRATLRFPLDVIQDNDTWRYKEILKIWTAFASLHARLGMVDEARRTYRYIENQKNTIGGSSLGSTQEDPPAGLIRSENSNSSFDKSSNSNQGALPEYTESTRSIDPSTSNGSVDGERGMKSSSIEASSSPTGRKYVYSKSPKRQRTENGYLSRQTVREQSQCSLIETAHSKPLSSSTNRPCEEGNANGGTRGRSEGVKLASRSSVPTPSSSSKVSSNRLGRFSARLSRKGLSGKAKRIEQETSILENSDTEGEGQCKFTEKEEVRPLKYTRVDSHECAPPKIKKMDLSYMWEWDPNARGTGNNTKQITPQMNPMVEIPGSDGQATNRSNSSTKSIDSETSSISVRPTSSYAMRENTEGKGASKDQDTKRHDEGRESISKREELVSNAAIDFLPLVHENNILRVNNTAYAKLGVIGKGGSCKVYRALSKQCSVVAIKKVKLEGMDKKAIEGYANEISLLQRLRGNPAIIQMYDSEVDLARKSIFVVMELGEADLNHVLQQRALSGSCRSLNMNFIRLTWQQMLSAVHCIHEERIIHSDLKPANFLFVRGALKLIDFGIAKAIQNDDTTNIYRESHIGTLNYMSPEAILDTETGSDGPRMRIGRASDVWSLGCILYEMVYGKTPFAKLHFIQKLQAIVNPNFQIEFSGDADGHAINAITLCLQRDPDKRPPIVGKGGLLSEHIFLHAQTNLFPRTSDLEASKD